MAITDAFRNDVKTGNIRGVRIKMKDSLLVDPTFKEFEDMERESRDMEGLYDLHDGCELIEDRSKWNEDYMNKLMVQVVGNFSHERLEHLKKVVGHLYPVATRPQQSTSTGRTGTGQTPSGRPFPPQGSSQGQRRPYGHDDRVSSNRGARIAVGAGAGGVAGGVIAGVAGGSVLIGAIAGAVIAGAAVAVITNGD